MFEVDLSKDIYKCYYCTIGHHKDVECGGIYYCPNPLCTGPGGAWCRHKLASYKEEEGGRHSVNWSEWRRVALAYMDETNPDEQVWVAFRAEEAKIIAAEDAEIRKQIAKKLEVIST